MPSPGVPLAGQTWSASVPQSTPLVMQNAQVIQQSSGSMGTNAVRICSFAKTNGYLFLLI